MPTPSKPVDLFIRRAYTYKGISIAVDIDLEKKEVSLVERTSDGRYQDKKWYFTHRTLEYMAGWRTILEAMNYAIVEASKELEAANERNSKKFVDLLIALHESDLDHNKKKGKQNGRN